VYAEVQGRVVEYFVSTWPEYNRTGISHSDGTADVDRSVSFQSLRLSDIHPPKGGSGPVQFTFYSLQSRKVAEVSVPTVNGKLQINEQLFPKSCGVYRVVVSCGAWRVESGYTRIIKKQTQPSLRPLIIYTGINSISIKLLHIAPG
jgi:hypothetical protein